MEPATKSAPATRCARLRWKGMFVDVEPDPSIPNMRDGLFWCSLTMTCLGPDGKVCTEDRCDEGRPCYDRL